MGKSKYFTNVEPKLKEIEEWAKDGLSDRQISINLGIAYSTFREYKKQFPALSAPLKKGKECAVKEVENALFKRAKGYEYEEYVEELEVDEETGAKVVKSTKVTRKVVHPDVGAIVFYLKNRKPDKWKDNPHKVKYDNEILELRKKETENKGW